MKGCFFGHKWGRWSDPVNAIATEYVDDFAASLFGEVARKVSYVHQQRECVRCGFAEVRKFRGAVARRDADEKTGQP